MKMNKKMVKQFFEGKPSPEMGLTRMAKMKKEIKRAEKVRMIAEGNELANANIDLFKKL